MRVAVVTIFPEMFDALTEYGVTRRAFEKNIIEIKYFNPRDFTDDIHNSIDDRPYGGGPGMVMSPEPLKNAIVEAKQWINGKVKVIYLSPQGKLMNQSRIKALSEEENLIFLAGRYEGIDERIILNHVDYELSIGDYIVSGGELPAMVVLDAIIRYKPGVLGNDESVHQESFSEGIFDSPNYTRPEIFENMQVPKVLLSGDHKKIKDWRRAQAITKTKNTRPDLVRGNNNYQSG